MQDLGLELSNLALSKAAHGGGGGEGKHMWSKFESLVNGSLQIDTTLVYGNLNLEQPISQPKIVQLC